MEKNELVEDLDDSLSNETEEVQAKRAKLDSKMDIQEEEEEETQELKQFLDWCNSENIFIDYNKVKITRRGTSNNYGMVAARDIQADEILSRIPKSAILEPNTTKISELMSKKSKDLKTKSNWARLIISIMFELNNPCSRWKTYLKLFPNYDYFDLPMFWDRSQMKKLLDNTCIPKNVTIDLENMKNEFDKVILPFLESNKDQFDPRCCDFEYYKRIVGFIMAYSFRDPNEDPDDPKAIGPMMVPVGDILNHIAKNNAQLRFEKNELLICSVRDIKKDEEVYNTYGEHSNSDLLHMYGFVEVYPHNIYDSVEIPTKCFIEAFKKQKIDPAEVINKKIETLIELELIDRSASIIIGHDGILNEEECLHIFEIYTMTVDDFSEFLENDCELLKDEEWDNYSLLNDNISKIPMDWKDLIKDCCLMHTDKLKKTLENINLDDEEIRKEDNMLLKRKFQSRYNSAKTLIDGQIKLLHNFLTCLDK